MTITRAKLESLVKDLLERTKQPCIQCLKVGLETLKSDTKESSQFDPL
jgi:molecular chaperone DnaK (HSP70)